jgi:hypothetical protein
MVGEVVIEDGCDERRSGRGGGVPVDHDSKIRGNEARAGRVAQ